MNDLQQFLGHLVHALEAEGRYGTAHVYRSTLHAFAAYWHRRHGGAMPLRAVFRTVVLRGFEHELQGRLLRPNTISTYMRMLRAVYHRALRQGLTAYVRGLFDGVYTGTRADTKRALAPRLMARLLPQPGTACRREQLWFALLFVLRGMPFVDLAHLRKCDLRDGTISYRRRKTGTPLSVRLTPEAATLLRRCADPRPGSPYLLDILARRLPPAEPGSREEYRRYQSALRSLNRALPALARKAGVEEHVSSYTARHTWATTAFRKRCAAGLISNALGHSSVKITETYLKPFENEELDRVNRLVIATCRR